MNKNQKGFSVIEGLLILVIVGIIGGVGFFVYNSQKQTNKSLENATKSSSVTNTSKAKSSTLVSNNNSDWKLYKNAKYNISFSYPSSWKLTESNTKYQPNILLKSPDFMEKSSGIGGEETSSGAKIGIFVTDTDKSTIDEVPLNSFESSVQKSYEANIEIAGVKAYEYEYTYEGDTPLSVRFVNKGHLYTISFDGAAFEDERTSSLFGVYTQLKTTIQFI